MVPKVGTDYNKWAVVACDQYFRTGILGGKKKSLVMLSTFPTYATEIL